MKSNYIVAVYHTLEIGALKGKLQESMKDKSYDFLRVLNNNGIIGELTEKTEEVEEKCS